MQYDLEKIKAQFPVLSRKIWDKPLVYLDSAASMQKPQKVLDAINNNYSFNYSNVHRGLHKLSEEATSNYEGARLKISKFINCSEKEIVFTSGATAAINLVAYSWGLKNVSAGDEIIISSPGFKPIASRKISIPSVALPTPTEKFTLAY